MPLDITRYPLACLCVHLILAGSSECVVSLPREDTGTRLTQGITLSIQGLQIRGFKIVSYHSIWVLRSNLLYYILLCPILRPDQDVEIILNPINSIGNPVIKLKNKEEENEDFGLRSKFFKRGKMEDAWTGLLLLTSNWGYF